jgi:hypothetical protein
MNNNPYLEKKHMVAISRFRTQFYERFGMDAEVIVVEPEWKKVVESEQDRDLGILVSVLNSYIPSHLRIKYPTIFSKTRKRELSELRMIFMKIAREKGNLTLKTIGEIAGKMHHSTIIYGAETANALIKSNPQFREKYNSILDTLQKVYQLEYARTHQPADTAEDNTQSASVIALHPRKDQAISTASVSECGALTMPEIRMDQYTERAAAESLEAAV